MKPGIKTTEFWVTVATNISGLAVVMGGISQDEASTLIKAVEMVTGGVLMALPTVGYIWSRARAKEAETLLEYRNKAA